MSSVRLAYQCVYERSAEAARIVLDLCSEGYSTAKIAKIMAWNRKQIRDLLKSISEEVADEVQIAEGTAGNWREIQHLLKWISEGLADEAEDGTGHGGLSDDEEAKARVAEFREDWFRAAMSTAPADRPRAEISIARMYATFRARPPRFLWCDSPMTAQLALSCLGRSPILAADGASALVAAYAARCVGGWRTGLLAGSLAG